MVACARRNWRLIISSPHRLCARLLLNNTSTSTPQNGKAHPTLDTRQGHIPPQPTFWSRLLLLAAHVREGAVEQLQKKNQRGPPALRGEFPRAPHKTRVPSRISTLGPVAVTLFFFLLFPTFPNVFLFPTNTVQRMDERLYLETSTSSIAYDKAWLFVWEQCQTPQDTS